MEQTVIVTQADLTLLDMFAMQALVGLLTAGHYGLPNSLAEECYDIAAAMLAERTKPGRL